MDQLQTNEISGSNHQANCKVKDREALRKLTIAQADSGGYDPAGYIVIEDNGIYYLCKFSHCSCYDTFDNLVGTENGDLGYNWCGFKDALIDLATRKADPDMPHMLATEDDYDYQYLIDVYQQVLKYFGDKNGQ